jgi:hypothetical protein
MRHELKRINPWRAAKIGALIYGTIVTIFGVVMVLFAQLGVGLGGPPVAPSRALLMWAPYPLAGVLMGSVFGLLISTFYNFVCRWTGGLLLDFDGPAPDSTRRPED